jgi:hypothetical protein
MALIDNYKVGDAHESYCPLTNIVRRLAFVFGNIRVVDLQQQSSTTQHQYFLVPYFRLTPWQRKFDSDATSLAHFQILQSAYKISDSTTGCASFA